MPRLPPPPQPDKKAILRTREEDLSRCPIFMGLSADTLSMAAQAVVPVCFEVGEQMLTQDRDGDALLFLMSGCVRVSRSSLQLRERVLAFVYAPDILGEVAVLGRRPRVATAIADTAVSGYLLHREHLEQLVRRDPEVLWRLSQRLAERLAELDEQLVAQGMNTESSMAHAFLGLFRQRSESGIPDPAFLPLTQSTLMAQFSTSRDTIKRVLMKLQAQGALTLSEGGLRIDNPAVLEAVVCGFQSEGEDD